MGAPALGVSCLGKLLLCSQGGFPMALGWGSLDDSVWLWPLWGSVGGGLLPVVVQVGFQLPALGEHRGMEPVWVKVGYLQPF